MFADSDIIVIEIEDFQPGRVQGLANLFEKLMAQDPARALARRFSFCLLFERAGVSSPQADKRSREFLTALRTAFPGFCYFILADPPLYHLRNIVSALAMEGDGAADADAFLRTHHQCFLEASKVAENVGDMQSAILEEAFIVNLQHRYMDNSIRLRALRALRPMLLAGLKDQDSKTASKAFREAAQLTDRRPDDFASAHAFVREMEQILEAYS